MPQLAFLSAWHRNFALHIDLAVQGQEGLHLSAAEVGDDHLCQLGRWLHDNAAKLAGQPAYQCLLTLHAEYHAQAERVIRAHLAGHAGPEAVASLHSVSAEVVAAINALDAELRPIADLRLDSPANASFWDDSLLIGHGVIDEQHKAIAQLGDRMLREPALPLSSDAGSCFLHDFFRLVALHFETEEIAMRRMHLPPDVLKAHFDEHSRLLDQIVSYSVDFSRSREIKTVGDITQDLFGVIIDHVVNFDLALRLRNLSAE